ncbi:hypothetical protein GCM10009007_03340 [Formosimonas limnophila]|uniref:Phage head morphogenesis domain-containing protein n=1 Tax=Formosimonas limnophila TaxID=1384487 RepID=A0A8J3FXN3_9BURK|nr:phage minor head protein [Formosimonas limnophila]GHA66211.1 hypothetical protein GCM10009007_03340 [Formosimonas limnophila]
MVAKVQTPPAPIKPESSHRKLLNDLIKRIIGRLGELDASMIDEAAKKLPFLFDEIRDYNARKFKKLLSDALGKRKASGLISLIEPKAIEFLREAYVTANTTLIRSVSNDVATRITREIAKDPRDLPPLIDRIEKAGNVTRSRARTIARTETAKLNADMSKVKSVALGITSYEWRTAGDERVRDDHDICDGKTYKYGEQTDSDSGNEPGQDVNCRCVAINVITDDVLEQIL